MHLLSATASTSQPMLPPAHEFSSRPKCLRRLFSRPLSPSGAGKKIMLRVLALALAHSSQDRAVAQRGHDEAAEIGVPD